MSIKSDKDILETRFIELETRTAYQDDIIQELSQIVGKQQKQLERLETSMNILAEKLNDADPVQGAGGLDFPDEAPPHY